MFALVFFIVLALIFYINSKTLFDERSFLENSAFIIGLTSVFSFTFILLGDLDVKTQYYYLVFVAFFYFAIKYIERKSAPKPLNVVANQQRYWQEITPKMVYEYYNPRKDIKSNRVEARINIESKKLIKNNLIVPQFFLDYYAFQPTHIEKIEDLENTLIFSVIFKRLKEIIKDLEAKVDYEATLKANGNYAEYFLMDLWESYTKKQNIGIAYLEILATNEKEKELIYALDLLFLQNVKRKGAVWFYKYLEFKGRLQEYLQKENNENQANEEEFDEQYAKENDSDKTPYTNNEKHRNENENSFFCFRILYR